MNSFSLLARVSNRLAKEYLSDFQKSDRAEFWPVSVVMCMNRKSSLAGLSTTVGSTTFRIEVSKALWRIFLVVCTW